MCLLWDDIFASVIQKCMSTTSHNVICSCHGNSKLVKRKAFILEFSLTSISIVMLHVHSLKIVPISLNDIHFSYFSSDLTYNLAHSTVQRLVFIKLL